MKRHNNTRIAPCILVFVLLLGVSGSFEEARGQFIRKWLTAGEYHRVYSESGGEPALDFPQQKLVFYPGVSSEASLAIGFADWLSVEDWTDPEGKTWAVMTVHNGPEAPGVDEVFPQELRLVSRFEPTSVIVDELETIGRYAEVDEVDPNIEADRILYNRYNTAIGVTVERTAMQFGNDYHDDYHILEYTLINTGNVDGDEEVELEGQMLEDLYLFSIQHYADVESAKYSDWGSVWGRNNMNDVVGDGMENYETDLRASFSWQGFSPRVNDFNSLGYPVIRDGAPTIFPGDSLGRLSADYHIGRATLHADEAFNVNTDDASQPSTNTYFDWDLNQLRSPKWLDETQAQWVRSNWIEAGQAYPHHADIVTGATAQNAEYDRDRFAHQTTDPGLGLTGGYTQAQGYGPYDIPFGDSIRFVIVEGAAGLGDEAAFEIGRAYKREALASGDHFKPIGFDADGDGEIDPVTELMSKQHWVMTARDSLFQLFRRARANYESGYRIPQPPKPPKTFRVTSGVDRIKLEWELFSDADLSSITGFEVYRGRVTAMGDPGDGYQYELVAELDADARQYEDENVDRGINYYYYIQVVGDPADNDGTGLTPAGVALRSNRYHTQTYDPAILKRSPGATLNAARVVPNPIYLGADPSVRWPDKDYRVGFLNIPGSSTIEIYTELGELVRRIEHTDGSGDEYWDLSTSSNQLVVSGVYLAVIRDNDTGEHIIRKVVVVR